MPILGSARQRGALLGMIALLVVALVSVPAVYSGHHLWRRRTAARFALRRRQQIPDALERMAAALRTGCSLPQALEDAGRTTEPPFGTELAELARILAAGVPLVVVLDRWTTTYSDRSTRLAATALALATRVGAVPAQAIDGVSSTLRERAALAAERHAQATQARTSAIVLSVAPLGFMALLITTNNAAGEFLFTTPLGWVCLLAGISLDVLGAVWMTRLTKAADQ